MITITTILLVLIQASPAYDLIRVALGAKPDILLIFLSFIAFRYGSFEGVIYGFLIGLFQDVVSSSTLGTHAIIFLNIGFFIGFFNIKIFSRQMAAGMFLSSIAYIIKIILLFLLTAIYYDILSVSFFIRAELLIAMPLTILLASPLFMVFSKLAPLLYDKKGAYIDDSTSKYVNYKDE